MPWLVGTALIHSSIVVEKRDTLKSWTILLAIITFSLSLVGTFLVRSGVLTSVHAFAIDPARGTFILLLLLVAIGGSLTLYAIRAPALKGGGLFAPISREGALVLNNLLLSCGCATVFLGTLYPLFLDAVGGPKLSVGFPFFNRTFAPLMVPLLLAVGVGPLLAWKRGDLLGALQRLWAAFAAALVVVLVGLVRRRMAGRCSRCWASGWPPGSRIGVLVEWAERVRLFRARLGESLRRAHPSAARRLRHDARASRPGGVGRRLRRLGLRRRERSTSMQAGGTVPLAGYELHFDGVRTRARAELHRRPRPRSRSRRDGELVADGASRAALLPAAAADHQRDRDPHQFPRRSLRRAGRPRRRGRLDGARLLEAAGAVDLDRRA